MKAASPEMLEKHIGEYEWLVRLWRSDFINEQPEIFNKILSEKKQVIESATGLTIEEVLSE